MTTVTLAPERTLSVRDAAEQRRSIRAYTSEPVPRAELNEILRQTSLAPSAWNLQPWRFVVVEDAETRRALAAAAYGQKQVSGAPAVIVLYTDMAGTLANLDDVVRPETDPESRAQAQARIRGAFEKQSEAEREAWGASQGYIALGYLLLAAEARGYATSPMLGFDPEAVKRLLGLPAHVRIPAIVSIGRGAEDGLPHHRHDVGRIARWV